MRYFATLFFILVPAAGAQMVDASSQLKNMPYITAGSSESFATVCTRAVSKGQTVVVGTTFNISAGTYGCDVEAKKGGMLVISGTVTLYSLNCTEFVQCVNTTTNSGTLVLTNSAKPVSPNWFGADPLGVNDSTVALNTCFSIAAVCNIPGGLFLVNTATSGVILSIPVPTCAPILGPSGNGPCGLTIRGAGHGRTYIKTTASGAPDLMAATIGSSAYSPAYIFSGFSLIGPDFNASGCSTTTSGNGFRISGSGTPFIQLQDIFVAGFCGSGKAGMWLDNIEDSSLDVIQSFLNDIGFKFTSAFNANHLSAVRATLNATVGISCTDCASNLMEVTVESNKKTGFLLQGSSSGNTIAAHFEQNNSSATAGVFALDLRGTSGHYVLGNVFTANIFSGTHENIGLTGVSDGQVELNKFVGGLSSSGANPFVISNGFYGSSIFDGLTTITKLTDPNFVQTILNDTVTGINYMPNSNLTGYMQLAQVVKATSSSIGGSPLAAGACSSANNTIAGIQAGDAVVVTPNNLALVLNQFYWYGYTFANTVGVAVCATTAGTPVASTYAIRVIK